MNRLAARNSLTAQESAEFQALSERLRAPDAFRGLTIRTEDSGQPRLTRVVVPATLDAQAVARFRLLAARQWAPASRGQAEATAALIMGAYPADRHGNVEVMFGMLAGLLASSPAVAVAAIADPTNPASLIRAKKFPPSIAEAGQWIDDFMRALLPSPVVLDDLARGLETLAELQKRPSFTIEKDTAP